MKITDQQELLKRLPLYEQVSLKLREHIKKELRPGQLLEPERKLALRYGVSARTLREALATCAHEGLVERQPGRGTIVLKPNTREQHVALVVGIHRDHSRTGYYFFRLMEYLHQFFADQGIAPRLYWARDSSTTPGADPSLGAFTQAVSRDEIAGIVLLKGPLDARWRATIDGCGKPVVGGGQHETKYVVGVDYPALLREAVRFSAAAGRRRIGLLCWIPVPLMQPEIAGQDVTALFREAVRQQGCETREAWTRGDLWPVDRGAGYALFREVWMAQPEKPNALVISDEALFADVATAILEIGIRVPGELLIVTHANRGSGTLYPFPTARLEYDPDETGNILGGQLLRLLRKEAVPEGTMKLPFRWVGAEVVHETLANRPEELQKIRSGRS